MMICSIGCVRCYRFQTHGGGIAPFVLPLEEEGGGGGGSSMASLTLYTNCMCGEMFVKSSLFAAGSHSCLRLRRNLKLLPHKPGL